MPFCVSTPMKSLLQALAWALLSIPAAAQLLPLGPPDAVAASTGAFELRDEVDAYEAGWEVRFAARRFRLLPRWAPDMIPVAGAMASSRSILYTYAGFRFEVPLDERWVVSPGWATGLYYRGYSKNLGGVLEFRSQVELAYRLPGDSRVGLC